MSKTVLVTGGGQGIGKALALKFASLGHNLFLIDINEENLKTAAQECEAMGVKALFAVVDVTDTAATAAAVAKCHEAMGGPDVLLNNAGIIGSYAFVANVDMEEYDKIFDVNVRGTLNMCKAVIPYMQANQWGRIINCSSIYGVVPEVGRSVYSATKAAVVALTKSMAGEVAQYGITVNAYAPGTVTSKMSTQVLDRMDEKLDGIPMRRLGTVDDVANAAAFLADEASTYITGAVLMVDGAASAVKTASRAWKLPG